MKCISIILILSFLYYCLGCYNTKVIKQEDEIRDCLIQKQGVYYLTTRNSEKYSFKNHHYKYNFENDTLYGSAKRITSNPWQKFEKVKFPVSDINGIETQKFNPFIFVVVSGALVACGYIFFKNNLALGGFGY